MNGYIFGLAKNLALVLWVAFTIGLVPVAATLLDTGHAWLAVPVVLAFFFSVAALVTWADPP